MSETPSPVRRLAPVLAAVLLVLVAFAPTLLFGESVSTFGLMAIGAALIVVGLLSRTRGSQGVRTFGTIVVVLGGLILVAAIALLVLLVGGLGRGV